MSGSSNSASRNNILRDFKSLTGMPEARCTEYLESANWDIGLAAQAYYADHDSGEEEIEPVAQAAPSAPAPAEYTGPRTLDGRPAPESAGRASTVKKAAPKKKGLATLSSIGGGHAHDDDDDEDDEDDDDRGRGDLFAGGEKSGLAVQDPSQEGGGAKKIISDILAKAKANASRPETASPAGPSRSGAFRGSGTTLGGEGSESRSIPDPDAQEGASGSAGATGEPQERTLHLWQDGFSIDDGELHRFDDPENAMDLNMIRAGRAPLHLMNVRYDQPVDVKLHQHQENYHPLPKSYKPFGGEGRRLGSPVPGEASSSSTAATPAASAPASSSSTGPQQTVDESQPTLTIRIQLPNGTRLPARFNTTNTVNDVYEFVQRASADTRSRSWVLATTFPNKDHTDRSLVLGEMSEFKKGGTAVVKWA